MDGSYVYLVSQRKWLCVEVYFRCTNQFGRGWRKKSSCVCFSSEIPVPSLKLITPWFDVFPNESVTFNCGMDGSADWKYMWFKDGKLVQEDNTASFDSDAASLSISSASASHQGQYSCSGKLKSRTVSSVFSEGLTLDVYGEDFFPYDPTTNHLFQLNFPLCWLHCGTVQRSGTSHCCFMIFSHRLTILWHFDVVQLTLLWIFFLHTILLLYYFVLLNFNIL